MTSYVEKLAFMPPASTPPLHTENMPCLYQNDRIIVDLYYMETSLGNTIPAYYYRNPDAQYTIIYSHGNAEDINTCKSLMIKLAKILDVNIMSYDYSGYSWSYGQNHEKPVPSEKACYADIKAVYHFCVERLKIRPEQIILMGRSLGSGPTVHMAASLPRGSFAGVILESPLASAVRTFVDMGFTLPIDIFVNIDKIETIKCPILIIHGDRDDVVPFKAGVSLYEKANPIYKDHLWVIGAGHNNIETYYWGLFVSKINDFIDKLHRYDHKFSSERLGNS